ncbi:MAG TPA: LssY C-terminal domain-containing protein [Bryobacteraceae bacterium]|nr:LssY C-terminal domain-containing protein [Bryobacteraceae bacterium]
MIRSAGLLFVLIAGLYSGPSAKLWQQPATTQQALGEQDKTATDEAAEPAEEELAPAAVQLDVSRTSPLIQALYQATRQTKQQPTLDRLAEAKRLIEGGADLKAVDARGRTALHWAVFGSSYNTKPAIQVAYEEIADDLIGRGVEINREDLYNDTPLDYLLYSPNFEMQTLLLEHGASSGFLAAFYHFFQETSSALPGSFGAGVAASRKADLTPGATIDVRLNGPVYSDRSRTGDPIEATVTYPLCKGGELVECPPGELLLSPGTQVNGTILFAQKAPDKYSRPRLVLDFSNITYKDGHRAPLYARVLGVDNARETVRNNEILGIIQPHASTKASILMAAASASNPIAGYTIRGMQAVYGLSIRREVLFPAGTDLQIQVVRPSMLKHKEQWPGWRKMEVDTKLQALVAAAPLRTHTANRTASDVTNLMFLGTEQQLTAAFNEAGWFEADDLSMRSAVKTLSATIRQSNYASAPVSSLRIDGQPPDLVFQKSLNTFAKRHHLRIWKENVKCNGREVWIGAATHDIAISNSRARTKWSHRIDPHIDRERDWVETDLLFAGTAVAYADVDRPAAPHKTTNATGDQIVTDGKMTVLELGAKKGTNELQPEF